jgi:hypothetical protein
MENQTVFDFCQEWLKAWTGNRPDKLIQFYHSDILYKDPSVRHGIAGRDQLNEYLVKLLAENPQWQWDMKEMFPLRSGFCLKWLAHIPKKDELVVVEGMGIVELQDQKIIRNELYFDTHLVYES